MKRFVFVVIGLLASASAIILRAIGAPWSARGCGANPRGRLSAVLARGSGRASHCAGTCPCCRRYVLTADSFGKDEEPGPAAALQELPTRMRWAAMVGLAAAVASFLRGDEARTIASLAVLAWVYLGLAGILFFANARALLELSRFAIGPSAGRLSSTRSDTSKTG